MSEDRAHGPYKHGKRWRVITVDADGNRKYESEREGGPLGFSSREAALEFIAGFRDAASGITLAGAVDAYRDHLRAAGKKPGTVTTTWHRLRALLDVTNDQPLYKLPSLARRLFDRRAAAVSVDTLHGELAAARGMAEWAIGKGWMAEDPWEACEVVGRRRRGKPQLRIDESRKLLEAALGEQTAAGMAVALALITGARASELTDRVVRDLDDGARVLWIDEGKTANARRALEIPEALRPRMRALTRGRRPEAPLFGMTSPRGRGSRPVDRHWLAYHTGRLLKVAGLDQPVTPHGLRGTHASIAARAIPLDHVAAALGQEGPDVTRRHYVAPGAEAAGRQQVVLGVLKGGRR